MEYHNRDELIDKAKELRDGGLSYQEIVDRLGVGCVSTIRRWLCPERTRQVRLEYIEKNMESIKIDDSEYYMKNREKILVRQKARYAAKKEEIAKKEAIYREKNKDKINARKRTYYLANKEKIAKRKSIWRSENKNLTSEYARRRRARMSYGKNIDEDQYNSILAEQENRCFYCGKLMLAVGSQYDPDYYTVEHINPVSNGGFHELSNVVYVCNGCNHSKCAKLVENWMPEILSKIEKNPRLKYDIEEAHMRWLI